MYNWKVCIKYVWRALKGLFTEFTWGIYGTSSEIRFTLSVIIFSIPVPLKADSMVSRIGPKWFTDHRKGASESIRSTIKSTVEAKGIEKMKKKI